MLADSGWSGRGLQDVRCWRYLLVTETDIHQDLRLWSALKDLVS